MNQLRQNVFFNLVFNYSAIAFNIASGIFLIPFYLKFLPVHVYGSYLLAGSIASLIGLLEFGLSTITTQVLGKRIAKSDNDGFRATLYSATVLTVVLICLCIIITCGLAPFIPYLAKTPATYSSDITVAFLLLGLSSGLSIYLNLYGSVFQAMLRSEILGLINILSSILGILTIVIVFNISHSVTSIALGNFVRVFLGCLLIAIKAHHFLAKKQLSPIPAPYENILQLAKDCLPVFLGGSSKNICENFQNILIGAFISPKILATYTFTQKIYQICVMMLAPLGSSIYSSFARIKLTENHTENLNIFEKTLGIYYTLSATLVAVAFATNKSLVSLWVGSSNFGGISLNLLIASAALFAVRHTFSSYLIYSSGKFHRVAVVDIFYSGGRLLLMIVLIRLFGLVAIPLADLISGMAFLYVLSGKLLLKSLPISIDKMNPFTQGIPLFFVLVALYIAFTFQGDIDFAHSDVVGKLILFISVYIS